MVAIYDLMNKGEANLSGGELSDLSKMTAAAEEYEDKVLHIRPSTQPDSIITLLEQKMYENKMTQAALAATLGIGKSKLSEILNGKRKPDVPFLKALYKKINIDPALLLEYA